MAASDAAQTLLQQIRSAAAGIRDTPTSSSSGSSTESAAQLQARLVSATRLFAELRAASRAAWLSAEEHKDGVQKDNSTTDAHYLLLENLLYERDHLRDEIARTRSLATPEFRRIMLPTLPPRADGAPSPAPGTHESIVEQLALEAALRRGLEKDLNASNARLHAAKEAVAAKQAFLDSLPSKLASLGSAMAPFRQALGLYPEDELPRASRALQLPEPLYVLFSLLSSMADAEAATRALASPAWPGAPASSPAASFSAALAVEVVPAVLEALPTAGEKELRTVAGVPVPAPLARRFAALIGARPMAAPPAGGVASEQVAAASSSQRGGRKRKLLDDEGGGGVVVAMDCEDAGAEETAAAIGGDTAAAGAAFAPAPPAAVEWFSMADALRPHPRAVIAVLSVRAASLFAPAAASSANGSDPAGPPPQAVAVRFQFLPLLGVVTAAPDTTLSLAELHAALQGADLVAAATASKARRAAAAAALAAGKSAATTAAVPSASSVSVASSAAAAGLPAAVAAVLAGPGKVGPGVPILVDWQPPFSNITLPPTALWGLQQLRGLLPTDAPGGGDGETSIFIPALDGAVMVEGGPLRGQAAQQQGGAGRDGDETMAAPGQAAPPASAPSPGAATSALLSRWWPRGMAARPYSWVQWLAGMPAVPALSPLPTLPSRPSPAAPKRLSVARLLDVLRGRLAVLVTISKTSAALTNLGRGATAVTSLPLPASLSGEYIASQSASLGRRPGVPLGQAPASPGAADAQASGALLSLLLAPATGAVQLLAWEAANGGALGLWEAAAYFPAVGAPLLQSARFYRAVLQGNLPLNAASLMFQALLYVPVDYPLSPSLISLSLLSSSAGTSAAAGAAPLPRLTAPRTIAPTAAAASEAATFALRASTPGGGTVAQLVSRALSSRNNGLTPGLPAVLAAVAEAINDASFLLVPAPTDLPLMFTAQLAAAMACLDAALSARLPPAITEATADGGGHHGGGPRAVAAGAMGVLGQVSRTRFDALAAGNPVLEWV